MDLNQNFTALDADALATYAAQIRAAFEAIASLDAPTEAQVAEAEGYADHLDAIAAEQTARTEAAEALASRTAALRTRFSTEAPEEPAEDEDEDEAEEVEGEVQETPEAPDRSRRPGPLRCPDARPSDRPPGEARPPRAPLTITAAADVPDFAAGAKLGGLEQVGTAVVNRMRGFGPPSGDGTREDLRHVGVASFKLEFPAELTIDRHSDDMEVLSYASQEARLPGGSLVAAGGWCAPSETIYDLCAGETTDGLVSVPEVNVSRGGIKYTRGPDFSDIYDDAGFCQTEAQAIAGTTKPCQTIECPPFVDVRLDACGLCIKVPILTNAAYPELVQRYVSGSMIAHQHKMNAKVLAALEAGSVAKTAAGLGAVSTDTFEALTLYAASVREKYRLGLNSSLEVILPFYVQDILRADISRRNGIEVGPITDAIIAAEFAARKLSVQYVYDWHPLGEVDAWPGTFPVLMYPAGAWIKGTADIINLNAVYDAASLATNTYTALFFEQGILVAPQCFESLVVTIPVCTAGRTGAADLVCAVTP